MNFSLSVISRKFKYPSKVKALQKTNLGTFHYCLLVSCLTLILYYIILYIHIHSFFFIAFKYNNVHQVTHYALSNLLTLHILYGIL